MIRVVKRQTAHQEHICDECQHLIEYGRNYLRVVQFESWEEVGLKEPDLEGGDSHEIWREVARHPNTLILKTHEEGKCLT